MKTECPPTKQKNHGDTGKEVEGIRDHSDPDVFYECALDEEKHKTKKDVNLKMVDSDVHNISILPADLALG